MKDDLGRSRPIFYGWYIIAAGFVCMWVNAGMGFYAFPIFFVELDESFGWGMMNINLGLSISMALGGFISPLVGQLIPRFGVKRIIIVGALLMSASFVFFSMMLALWQYYLVCIVLAIGWTFAGSIPTTHSVSDWFEKKRGMATGIMMVGVGLGGFSIAPLTRRLIDVLVWKTTFILYAIATSAILIPIAAAIFKRRPAERGVLPDGELAVDEPDSENTSAGGSPPVINGWTLKDAVRTSAFWIISAIFVLVTFGQTALLLNQVRHFESIGISPGDAANALGYCAMLGMAGKLFFGAMADRYSSRYAMAVCFGLQSVGTVILIYTGALGSVWWFVLIWGFAMGGVITLQPLIVAECFGMKSFGVILGMTFVATTIGSAAGPPFAGMIFDKYGSYVMAFAVFIITYAIGAIMSFLAVPPKPLQTTG
jgi:MFS family permease